MDRNVINRKLNSLARCVQRIETKRPQTPEQLVSDIDLPVFRNFATQVIRWADTQQP